MTTILVMVTQSLASVKASLSEVVSNVAGTHERVTITKNGAPVAVILAAEDYESLIETLAVQSDPAAMAEIRQAERDIAAGATHDETEIRAALAARRA